MRGLDAIVYVRVMGEPVVDPYSVSWQNGYMWEDTYYSTDIAKAWQVVEKMGDDNAFRGGMISRGGFFGTSEEVALRICVAALVAVGVDEDKVNAVVKAGIRSGVL